MYSLVFMIVYMSKNQHLKLEYFRGFYFHEFIVLLKIAKIKPSKKYSLIQYYIYLWSETCLKPNLLRIRFCVWNRQVYGVYRLNYKLAD
jgi:hypothetical protein